MQFVGKKKKLFLHFFAFFGCSDYLPLACSSVSHGAKLLADRSLPESWPQTGESNSDQRHAGIERSLRNRQIWDWLTTGRIEYRGDLQQLGPEWKQRCIFTSNSVSCGFIWTKPVEKRVFWWAVLDLIWLKCVLWWLNEEIQLISGLPKRETWIQKV